jgi:hypothetical protein
MMLIVSMFQNNDKVSLVVGRKKHAPPTNRQMSTDSFDETDAKVDDVKVSTL